MSGDLKSKQIKKRNLTEDCSKLAICIWIWCGQGHRQKNHLFCVNFLWLNSRNYTLWFISHFRMKLIDSFKKWSLLPSGSLFSPSVWQGWSEIIFYVYIHSRSWMVRKILMKLSTQWSLNCLSQSRPAMYDSFQLAPRRSGWCVPSYTDAWQSLYLRMTVKCFH